MKEEEQEKCTIRNRGGTACAKKIRAGQCLNPSCGGRSRVAKRQRAEAAEAEDKSPKTRRARHRRR